MFKIVLVFFFISLIISVVAITLQHADGVPLKKGCLLSLKYFILPMTLAGTLLYILTLFF